MRELTAEEKALGLEIRGSYTTGGRAIRHKWYEECLVDKNNNVWVLSEYTLDEAIEASKTLVNCEWCVNCHHCQDSKNCLDCVDCRGYENLKNKKHKCNPAHPSYERWRKEKREMREKDNKEQQ